jgi:hypothetical protein
MTEKVKILDVVALTEDLPERKLARGQVGTVVEFLAPGVFEVEFADNDGRTYMELPVQVEKMLILHYEPAFV